MALVFLGSYYVIQKQVIFPTFVDTEQQQANVNLDRVEGVINDTITQLDKINYDMADWDLTYQFIQDRNQSYIDDYLSVETFENFQVDMVYFYNIEDELIWGETYETKDGSTEIITTDEYIQQSYTLLKPYMERLQNSGIYYSTGVIVQDNVPILFSIRPIVLSNQEEPSEGYLIMGKLINDSVLRQYQQIIKIDFSIEVIDPEAVNAGLNNTTYSITKLNNSFLRVSKYFYSQNIPILKLSTTSPRDITRNGIASINYALYTLSVVCLISMVIIWLALRKSVLQPISKLSEQMQKITNNKDYTLRTEINSNDEIGLLAKKFNRMLSIIQSRNTELQKAYRNIRIEHEKSIKVEIKLLEANAQLQHLTITDPLTGIANRLSFENKLKEEWKTLKRSNNALSIIMVDIDCFKAFNDHYGHQAGDDCLIKVANILAKCLKRPNDLAARYGGEEFILILPNTDINSAQFLAENIQKEIASCHIKHCNSNVSNMLTISLGISWVIPSDKSSIEILISQADSALYKAKKNGRNRFEAWDLGYS
jgi:diguanylate cyclase (GGDEF)-like protein